MHFSFREAFFPTEEEKQKQKELLDKIRREAREEKHCIACKNYSYDASIPGFVTYEGDCSEGHVACFGNTKDILGIFCNDFEMEELINGLGNRRGSH